MVLGKALTLGHVESSSAESAVVVWLHGFGDSPGGWAQALQPFRTTLEVPLKWVHLCAPLLSQPCFGNRKERIQVGSTDYDDLDAEGAYGRSVADVLAELHDLEQALPNSTRLLIGGFSQGAAIALECALKYPKPLAGCIVVAGWARPTVREFLAEGSTSKTQTPFLLCHGEADDMVDVNCSRILKDLLSKKGAEVQLQTYPGIQHESCPELLNAVMEFMCKGLKLPIPTSITWDDSDSESDTAVVYVSKSRLADLQRASSDVSQAALLELVDPTGLAETETLVPAVLHQPDAIMKLPPAEAIKAIAEAVQSAEGPEMTVKEWRDAQNPEVEEAEEEELSIDETDDDGDVAAEPPEKRPRMQPD